MGEERHEGVRPRHGVPHAREGLPNHAKQITTITPNGLDADYYVDGPNHNHKFMYASAPNRGLRQVLLAWPSIRAAVRV